MTDGLLPLFAACQSVGLEATAEDVADALWLVRCGWTTRPATPIQESLPEPPVATPSEALASPEATPDPSAEPVDHTSGASPGDDPIDPNDAGPVDAALPTPGEGQAGREFEVAAAPVLSNPLALARSLRPLVRRAPSRTRFALDVDETVRRFTEERVLVPVIRPESERWLRLSLVIDGGSGGDVWRDTVREFRAVLANVGAFRDVRVWGLDADGPIPRMTTFGTVGRADRHPDELTDPLGKTLTAVMSAFVAPGWRDGSVAKVLDRWAASGPVVLIPLLPERLWARTALGAAQRVRVSASGPGGPGVRLRYTRMGTWRRLSPERALQRTVPAFPLAVLEPESLERWAAVLAGRPGAAAPGVLYPQSMPRLPAEPAAVTDRLDLFRQTASPVARQLAGLLAATPVSLAVIRLIRRTLLPEAGLSHEVEVLFGGVLRRVSEPGAADPQFEFHPGVRERLLDAARPDDSLIVLEAVSKYLGERFGGERTFPSVLADPRAAVNEGAVLAGGSPFAQVAAAVLLRAGGAYARLVHGRAPTPATTGGPSTAPANEPQVVEEPDAPGETTAMQDPPPEDSRELDLPRTFGRYELLEVLGQGGMGIVYRARPSGGAEVALKMPRPDRESTAVRERFRREVLALQVLRKYDGIVPILESGEFDGAPYFTMPVTHGATLDRGNHSPLAAARLVAAVANVMQLAHDEGVVHRNLKPNNILIESTGRPVVIDFGLVLFLERGDGALAGADPLESDERGRLFADDRLTETGAVMGTPMYMSPEQASGRRELIGAMSDVFALGGTLYKLLTGQPPGQGESVAHVIDRLKSDEPVPPPVSLVPDLDPRLNDIVERAIAKRPSDRWPSMRDFANALTEYVRTAEVAPAGKLRNAVALVVGVGYYANTAIAPLRYVASDAVAVAEKLTDRAVCGFPADRVMLLTDRAATRVAVVDNLTGWLTRHSRGADIAVIYFAGHTASVGSETYLLPHDADPNSPASRGISIRNLAPVVAGLEAKAVLVCVDGSYPGLGGKGVRPEALRPLLGNGRYLVTACDANQTAIEDDDNQHGLFARCLLRGLDGAADRDGDGRIGLAELLDYVAETVPREAKRLGAVQQPRTALQPVAGAQIAVVRRAAVPRPATAKEVDLVRRLPLATSEGELLDLLAATALRRDSRLTIAVVARMAATEPPAVRHAAAAAFRAIGTRAAFDEIEDAARRADPALERVLDGLATLRSRDDLCALLNQVVDLTSGAAHAKAAALLERKRAELNVVTITQKFKDAGSPYELKRQLGSNRLTTSYLGRDTSTNRDVVVRVLRDEFASVPSVRQQFLDTARFATTLTHPNLVKEFPITKAPPDVPCAFHEHINGVTLRDAIRRGDAFPPSRVVEVLRQLLGVLDMLATKVVVHGGVRPTNIFPTTEGRTVLGQLDLQIPLAAASWDDTDSYRAPEVILDEPVGPPADLFSLGCVAYELFCGTPPFVASNRPELVNAHRSGAVPASSHRSGVGRDIDAFLAKLLARNPHERGTAADATRALLALGSRVPAE